MRASGTVPYGQSDRCSAVERDADDEGSPTRPWARARSTQMTEKEDEKVGEDFVQAWRIMDEVIGSILRENPNLDPGRKRDQDVIARLLNEK